MVKIWPALVLSAVVFGGTIVVPNANTSTPGNEVNGAGPTTPTPGIFQELFGAGQFASTGPIDITAISFRAAPGAGPFNVDFGNVNVYLSTSPSYPNNNGGVSPLISSTFANNVGPDNTLVFSGTNVTRSDAGCTGPGVCPFDITFNLTTPFYYNPANGRLLMEDVFTSLDFVSGGFDGEQFGFPPGGSVANVSELGSTTATSGTVSYDGDIVRFTFVPVPEPASLAMAAAGLAALVFLSAKIR